MNWLEMLPAFAVGTAVVFGPGLVIAVALGLRRLALVAVAPLAGVSVIAVTSLVSHVINFSWGIVPVLAMTLVLAVIVVAIRLPLARKLGESTVEREPKSTFLAFGAGLGIAFLAIATRLISIFGQPNNISQTFDNVFHLNAVRYIVDTGEASPLTLSSLTHAFDGAGSFYPAAWHALTALVVQISGVGVPAAVNVVSIVIAALIWPASCMFLVRVILGARPLALLIAGVASAAFGAFPYLMLDFGVLYPNVLSISLLPATLALVVIASGLATDFALPVSVRWLALIAALPGIALAHPSTLVALIAFSVPIATVAVFRLYRRMNERRASRGEYLRTSGAVAIACAAAVALLLIARPTSEAAFWGPRESLLSAMWSALTSSTMSTPVDWIMTVLIALGVWAIWRIPNARWAMASYAIACGLYVISAALPHSYFRYGLTGTWYNDPNRLASLIPVLAIPLAVSGAVWLFDGVCALISRRAAQTSQTTVRTVAEVAIAGTMVILLLGFTQIGAPLQAATARAQAPYKIGNDAPLLSTDERTLLERLASEVPEGATVFGSPWTGTSLVYAFSDRRAIMPAIYGDRDALTQILMDGIDEARDRPEVCAAVRELNAWYILDFGEREVHGDEHIFVGLDDLASSDSVELIDQEGQARLYRVSACD